MVPGPAVSGNGKPGGGHRRPARPGLFGEEEIEEKSEGPTLFGAGRQLPDASRFFLPGPAAAAEEESPLPGLPAPEEREPEARLRMAPERLADVPAVIATFTVDRLAYSLSPPVVAAVIDFEGGGRFQCEMTDVDPKAVKIGDRVEMTFRKLYTANGVHNYFWKARPVRS
jgi:hypothetical protein